MMLRHYGTSAKKGEYSTPTTNFLRRNDPSGGQRPVVDVDST